MMKYTPYLLLFILPVLGFASAGPDALWTYKATEQRPLKLHVFLPEGYEGGSDYPVFLAFHGGSWREGNPSWQYPDCRYWASRGMVAISAEYRLKDRDGVAVPLTCIQDAKSAIRYLRSEAETLKLDPERIVVAGGSAGGLLAASLASIDAPDTWDGTYPNAIHTRPNALILYNPYFKTEDRLSPPANLEVGFPPTITFLGDQDSAISEDSLLRFHRELLSLGTPSEYHVGIGGGHGLMNGRNPANPFFYRGLELQDRFLVEQGLLTGATQVSRPDAVPANDKALFRSFAESPETGSDGRPLQPNLVFILTDDLGWQDVGVYDIDEPTPMETPRIDQLAREGIRFTQGYAPAPTCAPTRVAIFSGLHPARSHKTHVVGGAPPTPYNMDHHRMMPPWYSGRMPEDTVTLAKLLRNRGYATGHAGKWHMAINHAAYPQPEDQGFGWTRSNRGATQRMRPHRMTGFATDDPDDPFRLDENGFPFHQNSEDALEFVRTHADQPFFLYYATWLVHTPIHSRSRELLNKYVEKLGVTLPEDPNSWTGEGQTNPFYCAMVEQLDYHVGQLLDLLETTEDPRWPGHSLRENTYIVFTSDNGGMEGHPGEIITDNYPLDRGKISLMEGGTRVPLIVVGPDVPSGVVSDVLVNGLDLYPTFLSLAGAEVPAGKQVDGVDLEPLLRGDPTDPTLVREADGSVRDTLMWHFPNSIALESTIRVGDWKLVKNHDHVNNPGSPPLELYRLAVTQKDGTLKRGDIEEANNLAEAHPEKAAELEAKLDAMLAEMDADLPYYNPAFRNPLPHKETVPSFTANEQAGSRVKATYRENGAQVVRAQLLYTLNGGERYEEWFRTPAQLLPGNRVVAELPEGSTHWVLNLIDEHNFLVSDPQMPSMREVRQAKAQYSDYALAVDSPSCPTP